MRRSVLSVLLLTTTALAQGNDPAWGALDRAYRELRARNYDQAVAGFREALRLAPDRVAVHKDLGYTYLKIGETELARDHFEHAMRLDPADQHVALEFAFLCYETKKQAVARRIFDRLRREGNQTAEKAFRNIDGELAAGIERWSAAVDLAPGNFSAHQELARLAEQRDQFDLAAGHYFKAWQLRPDMRAFLLDTGRVWKAQGLTEKANAALLAASRGAEPYVAETARELLPARYPFVYEFQAALQLDPGNVPLRRELAYLLLEMGSKAEAETQFRRIIEAEPSDDLSAAQLGFLLLARNELGAAMPLLERAMNSQDEELVDRIRAALKMPRQLRKRLDRPRSQTSAEAKVLAERSLEAGYLKDALKYLRIAHENDPVDFNVMLKLGWTYNILQDDHHAIEWFRLARKSPDPAVASEADRAYRNLRPALARFRTSGWAFPFYSSRWKSVFSYAQVRTEMKVPKLPLRAYVSTRFSGDTARTLQPLVSGGGPVYLSESSFIFGAGLTTPAWKGMVAWGEAGVAASYLKRSDVGRLTPDYRGGLAIGRSFGHNLGPESRGWFLQTNADLVYISRFDHDVLLYSQNKAGWTLPSAGPFQPQLYMNLNFTTDARRLAWANTTEVGPGVRFRLPANLLFSVEALRGQYRMESPYGPRYSDFRVGLWYAFSR
jgi:Flp pilus assembly protein TadD